MARRQATVLRLFSLPSCPYGPLFSVFVVGFESARRPLSKYMLCWAVRHTLMWLAASIILQSNGPKTTKGTKKTGHRQAKQDPLPPVRTGQKLPVCCHGLGLRGVIVDDGCRARAFAPMGGRKSPGRRCQWRVMPAVRLSH
jgi:hypothetical protein